MAWSLAAIQKRAGHLPDDSQSLVVLSEAFRQAQRDLRSVGVVLEETPGYFAMPYEYLAPPSGRFNRLARETVVLSEAPTQISANIMRYLSSHGFIYYGELSPLYSLYGAKTVGKSPEEIAEAGLTVVKREMATRFLNDEDASDLWWIYARLLRYEQQHGSFPYDPRGPEYALFKLREDLLFSPPRKARDPLKWDVERGKVMDLKYDYLNDERLTRTDLEREPVVILSEKAGGCLVCPIMYLAPSDRRRLVSIPRDRLSDSGSLTGLSVPEVAELVEEVIEVWPPTAAALAELNAYME